MKSREKNIRYGLTFRESGAEISSDCLSSEVCLLCNGTEKNYKPGPDVDFINKITSFCKNCRKCAEACDAEAISFEEEPNYITNGISNNPGVKKWYVNVEECYGKGWVHYSTDCGKCIKVCPFSKTESEITSNEFWSKQ